MAAQQNPVQHDLALLQSSVELDSGCFKAPIAEIWEAYRRLDSQIRNNIRECRSQRNCSVFADVLLFPLITPLAGLLFGEDESALFRILDFRQRYKDYAYLVGRVPLANSLKILDRLENRAPEIARESFSDSLRSDAKVVREILNKCPGWKCGAAKTLLQAGKEQLAKSSTPISSFAWAVTKDKGIFGIFAFANYDGRVVVHHHSKVLAEFSVAANPDCLAIDDAATRVVVLSQKVAHIWGITEAKMLCTLAPGEVKLDSTGRPIFGGADIEPYCRMGISHDGSLLATGLVGGAVGVWETSTGKQICLLSGHQGAVRQVVFTSDLQRILSCGVDGAVRVWSVNAQQPVFELRGHTKTVNGLLMLRDGKRVASYSNDGSIRIWNLDNGKIDRVLSGSTITSASDHDRLIWNLALSADDRYLAWVGEAKGGAEIVNIASLRWIASGEASGAEKHSAIAMTDDGLVVVHDWDAPHGKTGKRINVWSAADFSTLVQIEVEGSPGIAITCGGTHLIVKDYDSVWCYPLYLYRALMLAPVNLSRADLYGLEHLFEVTGKPEGFRPIGRFVRNLHTHLQSKS